MKRHTIKPGADWTPPGIAKVLDFGVGQGFCPGRGFISWNPRQGPISDTLDNDCDGLVCITMGGPVLPLKAIHAFNRSNGRYSYIQIRWSMGLVLRTYLRFWLWIPVIMAAFLGVVVYDDWTKNWDSALWALKGAGILLSAAGSCYVLTAINERRHRAIRLLVGPHAYGSVIRQLGRRSFSRCCVQLQMMRTDRRTVTEQETTFGVESFQVRCGVPE